MWLRAARKRSLLWLSIEVMVTELPEEKKEPAMPGGGHSHGMEGDVRSGPTIMI